MATNNMHNLATLIKRLEAATSRLEDIASVSSEPDETASQSGQGAGQDSTTVAAANGASSATQAKEEVDLPPIITDFDTLISGDLKTFVDMSTAMGGPLADQSKSVLDAFQAERQVLLVTTKAKKPDMKSPVYLEVLKDLQKHMTAVENIRQNNRASDFRDHLAMVADGVEALGWVTVEPKPADFVAELYGGLQLYGNKILKLYKDKDAAQVELVRAFYKTMTSLVSYVKEHHSKGLQWNPQGVDAEQALREPNSGNGSGGAPPAASAGGAPPPPPPGPPPPPYKGDSSKAPAKGSDMGAVFADLNRGSGVTSGLKKVDPSMQTHKNPTLRSTAPVPTRSDSTSSSKTAPGKKPKPESMRTKKPPKTELDGNKWYIENHDSPSEPLEITAELNQSILITRCRNTTLRIRGKANAITIDNASGFNMVLDSLVSGLEVIRCQKFALQIIGKLPLINLDQVDGAMVYVSPDSLACEVMTSKCTAVNIYLPPKRDDGDYSEHSVPEQFRSFVRDGRLVTEIVEHAG